MSRLNWCLDCISQLSNLVLNWKTVMDCIFATDTALFHFQVRGRNKGVNVQCRETWWYQDACGFHERLQTTKSKAVITPQTTLNNNLPYPILHSWATSTSEKKDIQLKYQYRWIYLVLCTHMENFEWNPLMNCVYLPCVFMQMVWKVVIERQTSDRAGFIDFTSC